LQYARQNSFMELKTPIILITGSLGSGKTTLLRRIMNSTDRRVVLLMNEFGEIAIDSKIIQGENIEIVELVGGCVCCSLAGEFEAAVNEIIEKYDPEMIVVEATGVAEADALVYEVEDNLPQVRLAGTMCIVDAYASIRYPQVGYTARTQLAVADIILINKIDLVSPEEAGEVETQIRPYNDTAICLRTIRCDVNINLLLGLEVKEREVSVVHGEHSPLESFTFTSEHYLDAEKFEKLVSELPISVYRAKGFIRFTDKSSLFNYVAGRFEFEDFPVEATQLVFIGPYLSKDQNALIKRLHACEV
jgi:G3E family GTPase